jgi:hypothetical protein
LLQLKDIELKVTPADFFNLDSYDMRWTRITLVWKYLRNVTVSAPELWNWIDRDPDSEWDTLVLSRSESDSLILNMTKEQTTADVLFSSNGFMKPSQACIDLRPSQ